MAAFSSSFQQQQQQPFILDSPPFLPINIHPSPSPSPSPSSVVSVTNNNIIMDSSSTPALTHKRKSQEEKKGKKHCKKMKKNEENINKDSAAGYVHVRARRGQATDSHSLAERVRREKISERMKLLQSLVPGCARVTGKAPMLDEIINYIQSLQYQTEFLSMSLASLSPTYYDFGTDLESLMVSPDHHHQMQDSSNLPSPTTAIDKYPRRLLDDSDHDSLLLQQPQMSSDVFFPLI